jgi:hypothetical protein
MKPNGRRPGELASFDPPSTGWRCIDKFQENA